MENPGRKLIIIYFSCRYGLLLYFFNMQCPDCGYICFKQAKDCGNCGFNFKKAATSAATLFRNDSFTIFAGSKTPEIEIEDLGLELEDSDSPPPPDSEKP